MNIEQLRSYCLAKPGVEETLLFGPDVLVFKLANGGIGQAGILKALRALIFIPGFAIGNKTRVSRAHNFEPNQRI
jgi:hypothetical protein